MIDLKELISSGVQFGHQTWRWCPKMAPYIWGKRNGIHLIDVSKTAHQLEKAAKFLEQTAAEGKQVLWVGTKPASKEIIDAIGRRLGMPAVVHRWIGGTLTNNSQVKKSITKLLHLRDAIEKSTNDLYTKKERGVMQKLVDRLNKNVGGILSMTWPVGAIVIIDTRKEQSALREAIAAGVPVVALVDTNNDPSTIDYVVPGNDDVARSIKVIADYLAEATARGAATAKTAKKKTSVEAPAEQMISQLVEQAMILEEESGKNKEKKARPGVPPARRPTGPRPPRKPSPKVEE